MTVSLEVVSEAACSQLFTEQYGKFILSNDTVTAFDPDWDPLKTLTRPSQQSLRSLGAESLLAAAFLGAAVVTALIKILQPINFRRGPATALQGVSQRLRDVAETRCRAR